MDELLNYQLKQGENLKANIISIPFHYGAIKEKPSEYLKWIKFVPDFWNIDDLLERPITELTKEEKRILEIRKRELEVMHFFDEYVADGETTAKGAKVIYEYMSSITIPQYARLKLSKEQLESCQNKAQLIWGNRFKEAQYVYNHHCPFTDPNFIQSYSGTIIRQHIEDLEKSNNLEGDYISYLLKIKAFNDSESKLEQEIKAAIAENDRIAVKSMELAKKKI